MSLHTPVSKKDNSLGNEKASIVLVEYGDYECPHCGAAYPIVKQLQKHFGKDLLFIFRNFPLAEIHPHAITAAYVAEAAALQGKFWPVHDLIFEHQDALSTHHLIDYAESVGVDIALLRKEIQTPEVTEKVEKDMEGGIRSGVNGTPTFFINGIRYEYEYDFESMKNYLAETLTK